MFARKKYGFTLIELLVVIAIIAILAAILFPVFTKAKENAQKSKCAANLKQIASAVQLYFQDNNDYFPNAEFYFNKTQWKLYAWNTMQMYPDVKLKKYVRNSFVFSCPSDRPWRSWNRKIGFNESYTWFMSCHTSYFFGGLSVGGGWDNGYKPHKLSEVIHTSRYPVNTGESGFFGHSLDKMADSDDPKPKAFQNYAFLDGHVRGMITSDCDQYQDCRNILK